MSENEKESYAARCFIYPIGVWKASFLQTAFACYDTEFLTDDEKRCEHSQHDIFSIYSSIEVVSFTYYIGIPALCKSTE